MRKLKEGTPVWYDLLRKPRVGIIKDVLLNTYALIGEEGRYTNVGVKPLTTQEYINEVMVPDGWELDDDFVYVKGTKYLIVCVDVVDIDFAASETDWIYDMNLVRSFINLQQEALTHCERLNLLKELEA